MFFLKFSFLIMIKFCFLSWHDSCLQWNNLRTEIFNFCFFDKSCWHTAFASQCQCDFTYGDPLSNLGRVSHLAQEHSHKGKSTLKSVHSVETSLKGKNILCKHTFGSLKRCFYIFSPKKHSSRQEGLGRNNT